MFSLAVAALLPWTGLGAQVATPVGISVAELKPCTAHPCEFTIQQAPARPTTARTMGQLAGGALGAAAVGFLLWNVVDNPEGSDRKVKGDAGYTPNANTAYAIGSFVGAVAAVQLIGQGDGSRSSLARTAIGAAIPTIPLLLGREEPYLPVIGILFGAPLQSIGATIGYRTGRYVPPRR